MLPKSHASLLLASGLVLAAPCALAKGDQSFVSLALTKTDEVSQTGAFDNSANNNNNNNQSGKGEHALTVLDFSAGFGAGNGLILGAKYFSYGIDDNVFNIDTQTSIKGVGPMVGYMHASLAYVTATYLYAPTKDVTVQNGTETFAGGTGYVIAVGKAFEVGKSIGIAVQLAQDHVDYKKLKDQNGNEIGLTGSWSDQSLLPYVAAFFFF